MPSYVPYGIFYILRFDTYVPNIRSYVPNLRMYVFSTKVYKKTDFLRPVDKKVKTATIFVVKTRSQGFPILICPTGLVSQ